MQLFQFLFIFEYIAMISTTYCSYCFPEYHKWLEMGAENDHVSATAATTILWADAQSMWQLRASNKKAILLCTPDLLTWLADSDE